jgi:hypothetical protein
MLAVRAYYDGNGFIPFTPVDVKPNQTAIITILEDDSAELDGKPKEESSVEERVEAMKSLFGILKGCDMTLEDVRAERRERYL